ncbi:MAG TPA: sodium-translocating pyrophosphatase, partial [Gemmatimonadetes bacterium]|nr:sodium-translocating pyrophosphatase [Gemmatimonadota bacterium]
MSEFVTISGWAWAMGLVGLALAGLTYVYVKGQDSGSEAMGALAEQIHDGAMAFLRREYSMLAVFVALVAGLLAWLVSLPTAAA